MTIVCGTDLSEGANQAIIAAFALARRRGDRAIVVAHVLDPDADRDRDRDSSKARTLFETATQRAAAGHAIDVRIELVVGPAIESLVATTETEGSDLLASSPIRQQ